MKTKLFSTMAVAAILTIAITALTLTACGGGDDFELSFTSDSIAAFKAWLDARPANTKATAYHVTLNVSNLSGSYSTAGSLGNALYTNLTKYVSLDLSGSNLTSIGNSAFENCTSLASVTIPSGVTSIGDSAFFNCTSLASVTIPSGVTSIEYGAFFNCTSLTSVTIPSGVTSIGNYAFSYCTSLTSVTIPSGVTSIGHDAFKTCTSLASITIPSGVTSIGDIAFLNCTSLTAITVDSANTAYSSQDGVLYNKAKTTLITYPVGKTGSTFTIPSTVTSIEYGAFFNCTSLSSVTIPSGVTSIGVYAFKGCTSLTSVTFGRAGTTFATDGDEWSSFIDAANSASLQTAYTSGGVGTYTRPNTSSATWSKSS